MSFYSALILADSPSSYWRLDESSGTNAADQQAVNAGTYTSSFTLAQAGLLGGDSDKAVVLNGGNGTTNAFVAIANVLGFTGTAAFSLEAWVKPSDLTNVARRIFSKRVSDGSGAQGYELNVIQTTGTVQFLRYLNGTPDFVTTAVALATGSTYHVVATYDGTSLRIYINGVLRAGPTASSKSMVANTAALRLGGTSAGGNCFAGTLDEAAIYPAALSQAQVTAHYNAGLGLRIDAPTGSLSLGGSNTEAWTHADAITGALLASGSNSAAWTHADAVTGALSLAGSSVAAWTHADAVSGALSAAGTPGEQATGADSPTARLTPAGSLSDAASADDTAAGTLDPGGALLEQQAAASTFSGALAASGRPGEATAYADSATGTPTAAGGLTDASAHACSSTGGLIARASLTDSRTAGDAATGGPALAGSLVEIFGYRFTDSPTGTLLARAALSDARRASDTPSGSLTGTGALGEAWSTARSLAANLTVSGVLSARALLTDPVSGALDLGGRIAVSGSPTTGRALYATYGHAASAREGRPAPATGGRPRLPHTGNPVGAQIA